LLTLKKIIKNYTMKIKTEKKLTGSWITFYDSVLYAHGIINEDFYGTFRGGIARKFCEIFESDLRPWKTINEETVKSLGPACSESVNLLLQKINPTITGDSAGDAADDSAGDAAGDSAGDDAGR